MHELGVMKLRRQIGSAEAAQEARRVLLVECRRARAGALALVEQKEALAADHLKSRVEIRGTSDLAAQPAQAACLGIHDRRGALVGGEGQVSVFVAPGADLLVGPEQ